VRMLLLSVTEGAAYTRPCNRADGPSVDTLRMRPLPASAMYRFPAASIASPAGPLSRAEVAALPSPPNPLLPMPATVVIVPVSRNLAARDFATFRKVQHCGTIHCDTSEVIQFRRGGWSPIAGKAPLPRTGNRPIFPSADTLRDR